MMISTLDIKKFYTMREELKEIAEKEAISLWRLARRAILHGVSMETVHEIRSEADELYYHIGAYPERLLTWTNTWKYAFRGESLYLNTK